MRIWGPHGAHLGVSRSCPTFSGVCQVWQRSATCPVCLGQKKREHTKLWVSAVSQAHILVIYGEFMVINPLVNVDITMVSIAMFNGKITYFNGHVP